MDLQRPELERRLELHSEWLGGGPGWKRANLTDINLRGMDLCGVDLRGAILKRADLSYCYLSGAKLREADLERANLEGAILNGAVLAGANLRHARLVRTYAYLSDLAHADTTGADLSYTNWKGKKGSVASFA